MSIKIVLQQVRQLPVQSVEILGLDIGFILGKLTITQGKENCEITNSLWSCNLLPDNG